MTQVNHARVQTRETSISWCGWFLDSLVTTIKGIAHNYFPVYESDSTTVKAVKIGAKIASIPIAFAGIYLFPVSSLIASIGLVSFGMVAKSLSHKF